MFGSDYSCGEMGLLTVMRALPTDGHHSTKASTVPAMNINFIAGSLLPQHPTEFRAVGTGAAGAAMAVPHSRST